MKAEASSREVGIADAVMVLRAAGKRRQRLKKQAQGFLCCTDFPLKWKVLELELGTHLSEAPI